MTITRDKQVFIAGMTGTGKSHLIEAYMPPLWPVLKLDTKGEAIKKLIAGENLWPTVPVSQQALILRFDDLKKWDFKKQPYGIYVPGGLWSLPPDGYKKFGIKAPNEKEDPDETDNPELNGLIFRWGWDKFRFEKHGYRLWVDELKDWFENHAKIEKYMKYHYTKGRFFDIGVWGASQEPRHIHSLTMSQASHVFAFDLGRIEDRRRVADNTGVKELIDLPGGHTFWYWERGWRSAVKGVMEE